MFLGAAGLVSLFCSGWGIVAWMWTGAGKSHSVLTMLFCLFPVLSIVSFWLYFLAPRVGVAAAWLVLTGTYGSLYLMNLRDCARAGCPPSRSLSLAWDLLAGNRLLWFLAFVALLLMLDFTGHTAGSPMTPQVADHDSPDPQDGQD